MRLRLELTLQLPVLLLLLLQWVDVEVLHLSHLLLGRLVCLHVLQMLKSLLRSLSTSHLSLQHLRLSLVLSFGLCAGFFPLLLLLHAELVLPLVSL